MLQDIIVYIIVALALGGACRYIYRKLKALKKDKCNGCDACPLKKNCKKISDSGQDLSNGIKKD